MDDARTCAMIVLKLWFAIQSLLVFRFVFVHLQGEDLDPDGSQYDKQQKSRGERRKEPATYQVCVCVCVCECGFGSH